MSNNLEGPRTPNSNSIETSNFIDYNTMDSPPEESTRPRTPQASPSPSPSPSPSSIRTFDFNYDNDNPNTSGNTTPRVEMGTRTNNYRTGTSTDNGGGNPVQITDVKQKVSRSTYIFVMCAALNSCNLGYDIGVNTSAGKLLQSEDSLNLTDVELEIFMGSLNLFAAAGAIFASTISDRYGRKGAFLVAAIGFIFGVLIQSFANSYVALMIGRVFVGLGVGFGLAIDPIYIAEVSPASHRGRLVTWSEIATNVGIVFGFSTGLLFYNVQPDTAWRVMFGMGIILPCVLIYCVLNVMPESPRWLISKGKDIEAKAVLEQIYPVGYDIDALTKQIKDAIRRETEAEAAVGWDMIFFPTPAFRRMLLVGVGSAIAQQLVGVDAIQYFLDYILAESGVEEGVGRSLTLLGLGVLKLIVIFYAGRAFDKRGRRPLLFMSLFGKHIRCLYNIYIECIVLYIITKFKNDCVFIRHSKTFHDCVFSC
jgi:MFS family permease